MSQSEDSTQNTLTQGPMDYLEIDLQEDDQEEILLMGELPCTTVVCKEDVEIMIKCAMAALDSSNEILKYLLELNRMCDLPK